MGKIGLCMRNSILPAALVKSLACMVSTALAQTGYDAAPEFKASDIVSPAFLSSPHHRVREDVRTYNGLNHYVVESPYGIFVAHGNLMLQDRVAEVMALARLKEMSSSEEYLKALKKAAKAPLNVVEDLVHAPVGTLSGVPKGVGKFLGRISRGVQETTSGRERGQGEDGLIKSAAGVSKTKRELSARLGVNPYSSNEALQSELDRVAWVAFAGEMTFTAATIPVSGAAGAALSAISVVDLSNGIVYEQTPLDLRKANLDRQKAMGVPETVAEAFLSNPAFSPWNQTRLVSALEKLTGVQGRDVLVKDAAEMADSESDALFYEETARLIAHAHTNGIPLARIILLNGFPVCIGADGALIVALHWDYAIWSPNSERFAKALQALTLDGVKPSSLVVVLTGAMSPRLRQELEARGFRVQDRLLPGPLK